MARTDQQQVPPAPWPCKCWPLRSQHDKTPKYPLIFPRGSSPALTAGSNTWCGLMWFSTHGADSPLPSTLQREQGILTNTSIKLGTCFTTAACHTREVWDCKRLTCVLDRYPLLRSHGPHALWSSSQAWGQDPTLMVQPLFGRGKGVGEHLNTFGHLMSAPFSTHGLYQLPEEPSLSKTMGSLKRSITAGLRNHLSPLGTSNAVIRRVALFH